MRDSSGSNRARVMLYVPLLEPGGAEKQVERIAYGLDKAGFQLWVTWSDHWGVVGDRLQDAGVKVRQLPLDSEREAVQSISQIAPDIFHSFSYRRNALDVRAAESAGVPMVITSRVNIREWDQHLRVQDWELERNRATHWITAVSEAAAALCERIEGVGREKITVIHNGVEIPNLSRSGLALRRELNLPESIQVIGYAANYRAEKGHEDLLHAFRRVMDRRPETHLVCCGLNRYGLKNRLEQVARELGIASNLSLLESRADIDTLYRGLDVYVHPSRFEGFSNSILEAMANALPVVATAVGGTPEAVVDGITGLLVPRQKPIELAHAIVALLDDANRREQFGNAARERVQRFFSVAGMVNAYVRLYESLYPAPARDGLLEIANRDG